jgi:NAD(P)-dependent dehydrogenase (short-subunit alcohol dehydrogenase family)/acyl carrier protein
LTFDSGGPQDVDTLGAALSTDFPRVDAVYYDARGTATDDYEQSVLRNFYYPLQLIRAIGRAESSVKEFVFVTEGAQKAIAADRLRHGFAAMQWALARTARKEYPAVTFRLLDVPNDAGLDVLLKLRRAVDAPLEVAERNGDFYRPALVPASLSTSTTSIDPHGVYLITGGTRGVGLAIGQWLKAHGARRFILAARTVDDDVKRAVDSALGGAGIELMCVSVDLSAPQQIEQRLRSLLAGQALKGIVHAAGQQNAQRLKDFDVELARKEIDAKARSLLTLSELVDFRALDFVLCTSSITSLFGTPGAAAYGAANAFLDAYMQAFAPFNTRCHSVNFGAWSEVGMFAGLSTSLKKQFEDAGVVPMTTARGMRLLDDIFRSRSATFMAAEIDWPRLLASQPAPGPHDWLSAFRRDGATEPPAATASPPTALSLSDWQQQPASEKVGWLTARYRTLVAQTCQLDENMITTTDSMSRFGLDSVMALDLRQKVQAFCGLELSIPDILDDATIERLVDKTMVFLTASDPTFFSRKKWLASSTEQKTDWLRTLYLGLVARVCQLDIEMLSTSESMTRFGLDSIMALDIRQQIQNFCGLELAMPDILDEATIDGLVEKTRAYLDGGSQSPSER